MTVQVSETTLEANLRAVHERIAEAALRSGRDPTSVSIVAITKGHPVDLVKQAHAVGMRVFGENRVQEGLEKQAEMMAFSDIEWHMVGLIQSRKASDVAPNFHMVHSVDRKKVARKLSDCLAERQRSLPVLLQCNVSGEDTKGGWAAHHPSLWESVAAEFGEVLDYPWLEVRGLMTIAPWTSDEKTLRAVFARLRRLRDYLRRRFASAAWSELSMGMSDDYEIAVEEGATMVRLGRALFGPRP